MFFKNFLGEILEIENTEDLAHRLETKFGIPHEWQDIYTTENCKYVFMPLSDEVLSVISQNAGDHRSLESLKDELRELGVPPAILEIIKNSDRNAVMRCLFPYLVDESLNNENFDGIDKSGLEDIDEYVQRIPDSEKKRILKNIDRYIESFLK